MKNNLIFFAGLAFFLLIVGLVIWWEASLWGECRETNSFWYCMRVLAK